MNRAKEEAFATPPQHPLASTYDTQGFRRLEQTEQHMNHSDLAWKHPSSKQSSSVKRSVDNLQIRPQFRQTLHSSQSSANIVNFQSIETDHIPQRDGALNIEVPLEASLPKKIKPNSLPRRDSRTMPAQVNNYMAQLAAQLPSAPMKPEDQFHS